MKLLRQQVQLLSKRVSKAENLLGENPTLDINLFQLRNLTSSVNNRQVALSVPSTKVANLYDQVKILS